MLVLNLLAEENMYGYQIIEELARQSNRTFELKAGTLYPLLHLLEQKNYLESYDGETVAGKTRPAVEPMNSPLFIIATAFSGVVK